MKKILHTLMLGIVWLAGSVFFLFLIIYIGVSFLTKGIRKLLKWTELYHFREKEFPVLDVMHNAGKIISIGKLPTVKGETSAYHVPLNAKELLLEFKFTAYPANTNVELDYCLSANDSSFKKEFVYIFMNPFTDSLKLDYDRALLWYPLPEDRILKVQFADAKPLDDSLKNMEGYLNVVQVR